MFLGMDAVLVNVKAAMINFQTSAGRFCLFGIMTMFGYESKHLLDKYDICCKGMAVNCNIVKVYDDEFAFHWLLDAVHHAHELAV